MLKMSRNKLLLTAGIAGLGTLAVYSSPKKKPKTLVNNLTMFSLPASKTPDITPTRQVSGVSAIPDHQLTLFQFNNCPFSSKVRAYLDYYGFGYDVVEVGVFRRSTVKFSPVRIIPIVLARGKDSSQVLVDSSAIVSVLASLAERRVPGESLEKVAALYQVELENPVLDGEGHLVKTRKPRVFNKYSLMYGDCQDRASPQFYKTIKDESYWREWADDSLSHLIAPNIYCSPLEAYRSLSHFHKLQGEMGTVESWQGALLLPASLVMYLLGRFIKYRYAISGDEREILHRDLIVWTRSFGKSKLFRGGADPDLADLAVYGVLNSIEGTGTFKEIISKNPDLKGWYFRLQDLVACHAGARKLPPEFHLDR